MLGGNVELRLASPVALVVEDEWLWRQFVADGLAANGFTVLESASGERALEYLYQAIDVLVTDIRLGGEVSGWAVADEFRMINPGLPVIYLSANPQEGARQVAGSIFLGKPCTIEELLAACRALGCGRREEGPRLWRLQMGLVEGSGVS